MMSNFLINKVKSYLSNINLIKKLYVLLNYNFYLKKKLPHQLSDSKIKFEKSNQKTIIFSLIETSHPINFFLMFLAKIMQIKGYNVFALVCDQFLTGCEIKSVRNISNKNPCFECKFNKKESFLFLKFQL